MGNRDAKPGTRSACLAALVCGVDSECQREQQHVQHQRGLDVEDPALAIAAPRCQDDAGTEHQVLHVQHVEDRVHEEEHDG